MSYPIKIKTATSAVNVQENPIQKKTRLIRICLNSLGSIPKPLRPWYYYDSPEKDKGKGCEVKKEHDQELKHEFH